jgi:hypothetical protein
MNGARALGKLLLWFHLFVCGVWWWAIHHDFRVWPFWVGHLIIGSILCVQFTWGYNVGLLVGPSRRKRGKLWWSLLTIFMPLTIGGGILRSIWEQHGTPLTAFYLLLFTILLASETYSGVLLGAKAHADNSGNGE